MIDHIINSNDISFISNCFYCNTSLEKRDSEFLDNFHYKSVTCSSCGREHRHKVDFCGSGHDSWNDVIKELKEKYL